MSSLKITGAATDALLDAVASWDLETDLGYPFKIRGTAQELIMTMMTFAGDHRVDAMIVEQVASRVITEPLAGDRLELTLLMTNVIIPTRD